MINYIAKKDGVLLLDHLNNTSFIAEIYIDLVYPNISTSLRKTAIIACKLHDVLKIQNSFQEYIKGNTKYESQKFYHNELGWAFLKRYLNKDYFKNYLNLSSFDELCLSDYINLITDSIYFHHGNNYEEIKPNNNEILNEINKEDTINVINFIKDNLHKSIVHDFDSKEINKDKLTVPYLYDNSEYSEGEYLISYLLLIKNILIVSDRISSELPNKSKDEYIRYINSIINKKVNYSIDLNLLKENKNFNIDLYNKHVEISNSLDKFTMIKAPAGGGKTMIGLISGFKTNKKILWVCTKKSITKGVYNEILNTSKLFNLDLDVQCVYTGEVQEFTKSETIFESDIIVVNIDTFLSTTFKINDYKLETIVSSGFVIFDEFHEVRMKNAIFPISVILMNHRGIFTNEKTLLLSATPFVGLSDFVTNKIKILPDKEFHYKAKHNKKYYFKFINHVSEINREKSCIVFTGSISNTQHEYLKWSFGKSNIIHGDFLNKVKETKINELLDLFGKYEIDKPNIKLFTTNILQSAINISYDNMCEFITSPESTIQGIGRCNRNGENESATIYLINKLNDRSHRGYVNSIYNIQICNLWSKYIEKSFIENIEYTLDEIYVKYNNFNKIYENEIRDTDKTLFNTNIRYIENINIKRVTKPKKENKIIYANYNKLRYTINECFYIVKYINNDNFTNECFTTKLENNDIFTTFGLSIDSYKTEKYGDLYKYMEALTKSDKYEYDYTEILKKFNRKNFKKSDLNKYIGKTNKTPVIIYNTEYLSYNEEIGLTKFK